MLTALSQDGWVPLHFAAYGGAAGTARELLNRGAKVGAADKVGPALI